MQQGVDDRAGRRRAFTWIAITYAVALGVAWLAGHSALERLPGLHPVWVAAVADVAATIAVFGFSFAFRNSSFYDAYWSVAPLPIALYWAIGADEAAISGIRQWLVVTALAVWGARLTWNWARGWRGLDHEDWRYVDKRREFPRSYWLVSFAGIHMVPTIVVFLALLPAHAAIAAATRPIGWLDAVATVVTALAIWIEAKADAQLYHFRSSARLPGETLTSGLWRLSRHPNYFGEILFWWGLFLFALAANPSWAWTLIGPLGISLLFRFVSLPMIERRAAQRRPGYEEITRHIPLLIPRPQRSWHEPMTPSNP